MAPCDLLLAADGVKHLESVGPAPTFSELMFIQVLAPFKNWLFILLLLRCGSFLYNFMNKVL